eukprot:m.239708 g.239708  ORF g.239708 m.239708 type:complete len:582 (+) comp13983_c0_seq1:125-1870(+)
MHPKNRFRLETDFHALAEKFPPLLKFFRTMNRGKRRIDFRLPGATKAITCALLKAVYSLDVTLPDDRLVPTIPQKLNYVLWIDDLLSTLAQPFEDVKGVDIGCGASCIYPFLGVRSFPSWTFIATEADTKSFECARKNVEENGLVNTIDVRFNPNTSNIICGVVDDADGVDVIEEKEHKNDCVKTFEEKEKKETACDSNGNKHDSTIVNQSATTTTKAAATTTTTKATTTAIKETTTALLTERQMGDVAAFVMCNPPFFDLGVDAAPNRSDRRPSPKAPMTAAVHERQTKGGEVAFVSKMIQDSCRLERRIVWFTAMIGCKSHLPAILERLGRTDATFVLTTRFIQGKTHRWGVAWTFCSPTAFKQDSATQRFLAGEERYPYTVNEEALAAEVKAHKTALWRKRAEREGSSTSSTSTSSRSTTITAIGSGSNPGKRAKVMNSSTIDCNWMKSNSNNQPNTNRNKSTKKNNKTKLKTKVYRLRVECSSVEKVFGICRKTLLDLAPAVQYTLKQQQQNTLTGTAQQNTWAADTKQGAGLFSFTLTAQSSGEGKVEVAMACTSGSRGDCHTLLLHIKGKINQTA